MKRVAYGIALLVFVSSTLCLQAHETEEKSPAPGYRPESDHAAAFLISVGTCRMAVLPTIVRTPNGQTYHKASQKTILTHLQSKKISEPHACTTEIDLSQAKGPAQWDFFQSGMKLMAEQIKQSNTEADYHLAVEFLIPPERHGRLAVFGIHVYILDQVGNNAFSFLLNSHHQLFVDAKLKTEDTTDTSKEKLVVKGTEVALQALEQQIQQAVGQVKDVDEVVHCFDSLLDSRNNNHNATTGGNAYLSNGMVYFDGTSDYISIGRGTWSSNPCDGSSDFTIIIAYACTNKAQGPETGNSMLACIGDPSGGSGHLSIFTNNNGQYLDSWFVATTGDIGQFSGLSFSFSDGNMHYAFITFDASTDQVQLYALDNGRAVAGPSCSLNINTTGSGIYPRLGMGHTPVENDFGPPGEGAYVHLNGQIGYFAIRNRILSPSEMEDSALEPNPLAWWRLDETQGDVAQDVMGTYPGKVYGRPSWTTGYINGALAFDGIDDYIDCGNAAAFDITKHITIAAWIKIYRFDKDIQAVVNKGDSSWRLQRAGSNHIGLHVSMQTGPLLILNSQVNVNDRVWHHVAGVFDGQEGRLYVDGILDVSQQRSGTLATNSQAVWIGDNSEFPGNHWNGLIDDVRIYNQALTAREVADLAGK